MHLNDEERSLVYRFICLPYVKKVLERDLSKIKKAGVKFPHLYDAFFHKKMDEVSYDLREIKKEMAKRKITVYEENACEDAIRYLVVFRGYEQKISFSPPIMRNYVNEYLENYFYKKT